MQRKRWSVPVGKLPVQNQQESDASYFLRVNNWRKRHHIPDEVFVTVFSGIFGQVADQKKAGKIGPDDYKPQYIDFNNPLLVNLFSKLTRKVPFMMQVEEMLPRSEQMLKFGNQKFVTEHMVQWYHF